MIDDAHFIIKLKFDKRTLTDEEETYLSHRYSDSTSLKETYWRIRLHIDTHPLCPICNKPVKFIGRTHRVFDKTCSKKCLFEYEKVKLQTLYGTDITNLFLLDHIKEKSKRTCISKYGTEYALQNDTIKEKLRLTCVERYGCENVFQNDDIKLKIYMTNKERYGHEKITLNKLILDKIRKTRKENNSYIHSEETKQKISETLLSLNLHHTVTQEQIEKTKNTCLLRYGVTSYTKTNEYHNRTANKEFQQKVIATKKQNGTCNTSKPEDIAYNLLVQKYPNTIRLYNSDLYPFNCDFYIPEIDTYIECNFHWTHGGHEFNNTEEDKAKLNIWLERSKTSSYYKYAVNNWTVKDKLKIQTAAQNNLKYFYPYNLTEFKEILQKI